MTDQPDFLAELRAQHGPPTEAEIHDAYDMALDAWLATRAAEKWAANRRLDPAPPADNAPPPPIDTIWIPKPDDTAG